MPMGQADPTRRRNAHFHDHGVVLDGLFAENEDGVVAFHEAVHLTPEHWQTLQRTVQVRVLRTAA